MLCTNCLFYRHLYIGSGLRIQCFHTRTHLLNSTTYSTTYSKTTYSTTYSNYIFKDIFKDNTPAEFNYIFKESMAFFLICNVIDSVDSVEDDSVTSMCCSPVQHHLAVGLNSGKISIFMGDPSLHTPAPTIITDTKVCYLNH